MNGYDMSSTHEGGVVRARRWTVMAAVVLVACLLAPVNAADNGFDKVILSQEYTLGLGGMAIIEDVIGVGPQVLSKQK